MADHGLLCILSKMYILFERPKNLLTQLNEEIVPIPLFLSPHLVTLVTNLPHKSSHQDLHAAWHSTKLQSTKLHYTLLY